MKKLADTTLQKGNDAATPSSIWRDPGNGNLTWREELKSVAAWWLIFASCLVK